MSETKNSYETATWANTMGTRLVVLMYDGAIGAVIKALDAIEAGDLEARCKAVNMAMEVLTHLCEALDFEHGGMVAENLGELYLSMIARLVRVNMLNDPQPAREVLSMLKTLYDAWRTLDERITEQTVAHHPVTVPQPQMRAVG